MQRSALYRSRRELSNEYLLAKIGVDTAENEPLEVWGKIFNIIHWCPYQDQIWTDQIQRVHDAAVLAEADQIELLLHLRQNLLVYMAASLDCYKAARLLLQRAVDAT